MDAKSLFMYGLMASGALVSADLRPAATPKSNYNVQQRNAVKFVSAKVLSIEPSAFGYKGLEAQRNNAYDNFYRSNIDNEQDKRNFNTEAGQDHLPIRTYQADMDSSQSQRKLPTGTIQAVTAPGTAALTVPAGAVTATPGVPFVVPLRWNNPHAAELEVNVWLKGMTVVVPIKKPTCAGEGRQDAAFSFTIPTDFNTAVPAAVPGFTGCKQIGDCVLQYYAHSVEPRQYAHGVPLIITGEVGPTNPQGSANIEPARLDPGTNLSGLRELCLSTIDPSADHKTSVPRAARLISDVANHAYQNSDYSPYSGQQPESISKNLQASVIIEMIPSNGGELGKSIRSNAVNNAAANLRNKVANVVQATEAIVNKIIAQVGDKVMKNNAQIPAGVLGVQPTANTFRAAEVGSVTTTRLKTTTYIPSFVVPQASIAKAKSLVPAKFAGLVTDDGTVQLYQSVLNNLKNDFNKAAQIGLAYMGPVLKDTPTTMQDATQFKKLNAQGQKDGGKYASQQFVKAQAARRAAANAATPAPGAPIFTLVDENLPLLQALGANDFDILGALGDDVERIVETPDMDQLGADNLCDHPESTPEDGQEPEECKQITPMFVQSEEEGAGLRPLTDAELAAAQAANQPKTSTNTATTTGASIAAAALSFIASVFLA